MRVKSIKGGNEVFMNIVDKHTLFFYHYYESDNGLYLSLSDLEARTRDRWKDKHPAPNQKFSQKSSSLAFTISI